MNWLEQIEAAKNDRFVQGEPGSIRCRRLWMLLERLREYETEAAALIAPQMTDAGLRARLEVLEMDRYEASGELMICAPEPGTDCARVLAMNRLLKENIRVLEERLEDVQRELRRSG